MCICMHTAYAHTQTQDGFMHVVITEGTQRVKQCDSVSSPGAVRDTCRSNVSSPLSVVEDLSLRSGCTAALVSASNSPPPDIIVACVCGWVGELEEEDKNSWCVQNINYKLNAYLYILACVYMCVYTCVTVNAYVCE